ncbi:hypothetical protein LB505_006239 [Fusarium chuoi]|nr:hypothetical protein LB505_006239 [Fusarium chuoi]
MLEISFAEFIPTPESLMFCSPRPTYTSALKLHRSFRGEPHRRSPENAQRPTNNITTKEPHQTRAFPKWRSHHKLILFNLIPQLNLITGPHCIPVVDMEFFQKHGI